MFYYLGISLLHGFTTRKKARSVFFQAVSDRYFSLHHVYSNESD